MALFQQIKASELNENLIRMISEDWMLLAAGNEQKHNEMTVSWGGMGFLWNEPVATVYVRPQRYTFEFMAVSYTHLIDCRNQNQLSGLFGLLLYRLL